MAKKTKKTNAAEVKVIESAPVKVGNGSFLSKKILIGLFILTVIAIFAAVFFYIKLNQEQERARELLNSVNNSPAQAELLVKSVGKLMVLPQQSPTLATVSDINKLKGLPLFSNAKNGDKVLIYDQGKLVVIYRPSVDKIVDVGHLSIDQNSSISATQNQAGVSSQSQAVTPTPAKIARVTILNGSKISGLAKVTAQKLAAAGINVDVVSKINAENTYDANLVVDLSGKNSALATKIAQFIGGKVGALPTGENTNSSDILIILGANLPNN